MLHAPAAIDIDIAPMRTEFAALDASAGPDQRTFFCGDGSWSGLALIERRSIGDSALSDGVVRPGLATMPSVAALIDRMGWRPVSVYLLRQQLMGTLKWHFDDQALHLRECRLLLPLFASRGAVTWIGTEPVAYPTGTLWTGDFSMPHQVDNVSDSERVVLAFDLRSTPDVARLFPDALSANGPRRLDAALQGRNQLLQWRAEQQSRPA